VLLWTGEWGKAAERWIVGGGDGGGDEFWRRGVRLVDGVGVDEECEVVER
jgi:hypothetical protein